MLKENYISIVKTFLIALVFMFIGSIIGVRFIPPSMRYFLNFAFFILILFSMFSGRGGLVRTKTSMYGYAFILGILTGSTYVYYFYNLGPELFISSVLGVLLVFALGFVIASRSSEEKLMSLAPMLWGGMIALLIIELVNIFFFSFGTFDLIISAIAIVIYSGYAIYIMKSIQVRCRYGRLSEGEVVGFAYSIFISFLNLLLQLLRILSIVGRDD